MPHSQKRMNEENIQSGGSKEKQKGDSKVKGKPQEPVQHPLPAKKSKTKASIKEINDEDSDVGTCSEQPRSPKHILESSDGSDDEPQVIDVDNEPEETPEAELRESIPRF